MRRPVLRRSCALVLVLMVCTSAFAQLELGPHRLVSPPAPTLTNPTHLAIGLRGQRFLGRVGGVAFDGVAAPVEDLRITNLRLDYRPQKPDGNRLLLQIDGHEIRAAIYDWQLIPIAKFAGSDFFSCVTLFGKLRSHQEEQAVLERGGRIINYHPAFVNTLMGLRLFQLDNLIISHYANDLPKERGRYVLGAGEQVPDTRAGRKGFDEFQAYMARAQGNPDGPDYDSYVISNHKSQIRFGLQGDSLSISGEPSYFFFRYEDSDLVETAKSVSASIQTQSAEARRENPSGFDYKDWLVEQLIAEVEKYHKSFDLSETLQRFEETGLLDLIGLKQESDQRAYLRLRRVPVLEELLVGLRVWMTEFTPVEMDELGTKVSGRTELLRAINPAVWDAGVVLMRYSGFFRYCRQNYPQSWRAFIAQVNQAAPPRPSVLTPTVMEPEPN
jgi:hypothetical protein